MKEWKVVRRELVSAGNFKQSLQQRKDAVRDSHKLE